MSITGSVELPLEFGERGESTALSPVAGDTRHRLIPRQESTRTVRLVTTPEATPAAGRAPGWRRDFTIAALSVDLIAGSIAVAFALLLRADVTSTSGFTPAWFGLPVLWVAVVAMNRAYEHRFIGLGTEEFIRILRAGATLMVVIVLASYAAHAHAASGFLILAIPPLVLLDLVGRYGLRLSLRRRRSHGRCVDRMLLVGSGDAIRSTTERLGDNGGHGMIVAGTWVAEEQALFARDARPDVDPADATVAGITARASAVGADIVTVLPSADLSGLALRRLAWSLESTGTELVVCSGLVEITGARITVLPVAHSPMLHVTCARLSGPSRVLKGIFDRCGAVLGLILLAPLLVAIAVAIWVGDRNSPLFRQTRVGRNGREFTLYKFRTMVPQAEALKAGLAGLNENDGLLFKMRSDPRVTPLGRVLRRYSLDELPQLLNVVRGQMSLVGPRPPLPAEVREYAGDTRRRLVVKPGLTGLWQVSGRSDLSWAESVRLDLRYVENWSLAYDLAILWRTARAVLGRSGAY